MAQMSAERWMRGAGLAIRLSPWRPFCPSLLLAFCDNKLAVLRYFCKSREMVEGGSSYVLHEFTTCKCMKDFQFQRLSMCRKLQCLQQEMRRTAYCN